MGFIIDSNIFIAAARGRFSLPSLASRFSSEQLAITTIIASELLYGAYWATDPEIARKRHAFAEEILNLFPIIPFDLQMVRTHAQMGATLAMLGQTIGPHDLLIAATAHTISYGIITANEREFKRIPNLIVINPL